MFFRAILHAQPYQQTLSSCSTTTVFVLICICLVLNLRVLRLYWKKLECMILWSPQWPPVCAQSQLSEICPTKPHLSSHMWLVTFSTCAARHMSARTDGPVLQFWCAMMGIILHNQDGAHICQGCLRLKYKSFFYLGHRKKISLRED